MHMQDYKDPKILYNSILYAPLAIVLHPLLLPDALLTYGYEQSNPFQICAHLFYSTATPNMCSPVQLQLQLPSISFKSSLD